MKALILFLLFSTLSYSQMIPLDKQKHFIAGAIISVPPAFFINGMWEKPKLAFFVGWGVAIGAGITKESMDEDICKCWDNNDLLATTLGGLVGSSLIYVGATQINKRKERRRLRTLENLKP